MANPDRLHLFYTPAEAAARDDAAFDRTITSNVRETSWTFPVAGTPTFVVVTIPGGGFTGASVDAVVFLSDGDGKGVWCSEFTSTTVKVNLEAAVGADQIILVRFFDNN